MTAHAPDVGNPGVKLVTNTETVATFNKNSTRSTHDKHQSVHSGTAVPSDPRVGLWARLIYNWTEWKVLSVL